MYRHIDSLSEINWIVLLFDESLVEIQVHLSFTQNI